MAVVVDLDVVLAVGLTPGRRGGWDERPEVQYQPGTS